jgi:NSS family neurotransmitter:Na+ symporter
LPVGGLLIAIFAGWVMHQDSTEREFSFQNRHVYPVWQLMVRYVSPFLVLMVFLNIIGIFKF